MADFKTTIETIFIEAAKALGKAEANKLLATLPEPKVEEAKPEKAETSEAKPSKRISRMTPTLANQLRAELVKGGIVFTDDEKKEFEKLKKEFVSHVDSLTNDDFIAKNLTQHMVEFANSKKPAPVEEQPKAEAPPKKETKSKSQKKPAPTKEKEIPEPPTSNAAITSLTLEELQAVEMLASPADKPGLYWNGDNGTWVTGPNEISAEDTTEKKFKGKLYAIGDKTGRVYETTDNRDIFAGFIGVGIFTDLKIN